MEHERLYAVRSKLSEYVASPSLRHIRDPNSILKLAQEIVQAVDRASSIWKKWEGPRGEVAKAAASCWIPVEDLQTFLNTLPGPALTRTDVAQRLRAIWEEPSSIYPDEEFQAGCLALYEAEKAQGTELPAIIGALQEYIEREDERIRLEREERWRQQRNDERIRAQQRFLSGADCGWTALDKTQRFYCRRNGRAYRIECGADKRWTLYRIKMVEDVGSQLGIYQGRREARKALEQIAYTPEADL